MGPQETEPIEVGLHGERGKIDLDALIDQAVNMSRDGHDDDTALAVASGYTRGQAGRFAGRPQRGAPARGARFGATGNPGGRVPTPPRDPKDNKCATCNQVGHTKDNFPKPQIAMEERKCHICNKTGHIARR